MLRSPKDSFPLERPGVYKVDCSCGKSYIGQTKRTVACRISEHIRAVKNNDAQKSAIAQHILEAGSNHWIELHNPQVISTERHYIPRLVREAIEITKYKIFNREDGFQLSRAWNPVVQLCNTRKTAKKEESSRADTLLTHIMFQVVVINADCFNSLNDLLHLFVHILGLDHQHNMHDRDDYLHILWDQLTDGINTNAPFFRRV
uniref:SFRICE_006042 n=1 Tax=Spodoptera frugiperda TaxID=7108 RepID=A0A2H1WVT5_SPOFR